uniref:Nanos-type domain-containing protein n=1 Tax=Steinernema glaseri TaxID=37863 RepID=A0A1I7YSD0_9BILA
MGTQKSNEKLDKVVPKQKSNEVLDKIAPNQKSNEKLDKVVFKRGRGGIIFKPSSDREEQPKKENPPRHPCSLCLAKGESEESASSHSLRDSNGRAICPALRRQVCALCGATEANAHNQYFCPQNKFERTRMTMDLKVNKNEMMKVIAECEQRLPVRQRVSESVVPAAEDPQPPEDNARKRGSCSFTIGEGSGRYQRRGHRRTTFTRTRA